VKRLILTLLVVGAFFTSCSENQSGSKNTDTHAIWELEIVDSIQVDHLGEISTGDFRDGIGVLFDYTSNTLIKIDETGRILTKKTFPPDGPDSFQFLNTVEIDSLGGVYIKNFMNAFYYLNSDLSVARKIEMPFPSTSFDGATDSKAFELWKGKILMWYAGRDDKSPYKNHYLRDEFLLELFDESEGESEAMLRTPSVSKFASDKLYDRPSISFSIHDDHVYLTFSNEPLVHVYDLNRNGEYVESLDFKPSRFILGRELKDEFDYADYSELVEGRIWSIYARDDGVLIKYGEGMDEEQFLIGDYLNEENFPKLQNNIKKYYKVYTEEEGWSNDIYIPNQIGQVFEVESISEPFFALRNDEFLGEERDYITFYKLQLKKK